MSGTLDLGHIAGLLCQGKTAPLTLENLEITAGPDVGLEKNKHRE